MAKLSTFALGLLLFCLVNLGVAQKTVKIMPFGASIVTRCWRANLYAKLRNSGITNFDFVGSQRSTNCGGVGSVDQEHEGHPGSQATDYAKYGNLTGWLNQNPPDVIIMFLGHNDVLIGKKPIDQIIAAYDTLIGQMRNKNPNMQIVFSSLTPLDTTRKTSPIWTQDQANGIKALSDRISTYAPSKSTRNSPVRFVDNFNGFDPKTMTDDGEHPNNTGNEQMAKKFIDPVRTSVKAVSGTKRRDTLLGRRTEVLENAE